MSSLTITGLMQTFMISLAILGLMQALFLPGFLISSAISRRTKLPLVDNLLIATPLSIVLNYLVVWILVMTHTYTRPAMLLIIGVELVALLFVLGRQLSPNIPMTPTTGEQIKEPLPNKHYLTAFFNVMALGLLIGLYRGKIGSVFDWWDAVVSWNRWAKEWFNQSPGGTGGYPPGVPILYSLVYKLAGTTNIQSIAKLVASYFPFFGLFCFWRLGSLRGQLALASSLSGVIFVYLLATVNGNVDFVVSGYADPIMAALGAFILYALSISNEHAKSGLLDQERKYVLALITIAVSSIAMVKQSGVLVGLIFALMTAYSFRRSLVKEKGYWAGLVLIVVFLVTNYYVYWYFVGGFVRADDLIKAPMFLRPYTGFQMLLAATGKWLLILVAGSLFIDRLSRRIFLLLVVPLFLFWAYLVSYDLRTAFVFLPWLALLAGISLAKIADMGEPKLLIFSLVLYFLFAEAYVLHPEVAHLEKLVHTTAKIYLLYLVGTLLLKHYAAKIQICSVRHGAFCLIGAIAMCLAVLPFFKSADSLLAENTLRRIQTGNQGFNEKLSNLFEQEPNAKLISCFMYIYNIPALEGRFFPVGSCGKDLVAIWIARPNIEYLLHLPPDENNSLQETRELLTSKGISFTEETLARGYTLFKRK